MDKEVMLPERLSWSAVSTYSECGVKWLLSRGFKVPQSTWFATVAGSVIHEITEEADKAEAAGIPLDQQLSYAPSFATLFEERLAKLAEAGTEVLPSGRKLKNMSASGGPNKKDKEWWLIYGPIFAQRWIEWKAQKGWRIATMPDGKPGIELEFRVNLGGVDVLGYIDRVYILPDGTIVVVDLKTGAVPTGSLQLVTYAAGLAEAYGLDADWGAFWTPGDDEGGRMSEPIFIGDWSMDRLHRMYRDANVGIRNGVFLPQVTAMCKGCTVRDYCWAVAGSKSGDVPQPELMDRRSGEVVSV